MELPEHILYCIQTLERAGFPAYAVGGCVRDALLGIRPHDYDLCTSALPQQIRDLFSAYPQVHAGEKHGTVGVIFGQEVVEITTFRREGDYGDHRHPDWVQFVSSVEEDLSRRDFTVNDMAWSPTRGLADPFDGQRDLQQGILRAVGEPEARFREEALRILRGVRFAARFRLQPEEKTRQAMEALAPLLGTIAAERIFEELTGILLCTDAEHLLTFARVLVTAIPELAPAVGFDQCNPHHAYDLYTHIAWVTDGVPAERSLRWAAFLHDLGKIATFTRDETGRGHFYGHGKEGATAAEEILTRLKAPGELRRVVVLLISEHMNLLSPDRKLLRRRISRFGPEFLEKLLILQRADRRAKGTGTPDESEFDAAQAMLRQILAEEGALTLKSLQISGHDLMELGIPAGKTMGSVLNRLLELVLEEKIENAPAPLREKALELYGEEEAK